MITWTEKTVNINELKPYGKNPRRISELAFEQLKRSITDDGYHTRIKVNQDLTIAGGHMRLKAMKELGYTDITVLVPDRQLPREEFERILIRDNLPFGEYNYDILANEFDLSELADWGMDMDWAQDAEEEQPDNTNQQPKYVLQYHGEQLEVFCQAIDMATDTHPNDMNSEELSEAVLSICYDYIASRKTQ